MTQQPTYLLAPSFRFKPGSGPIALGNVIADPFRPHRALTTVDAATLQAKYPRVETIVESNRRITRETSHDLSMAVWAQFLQTVSATISSERNSSIHNEYAIDSLETAYFVEDPPLEEIEARVKIPRVQAAVKSSIIPGVRQSIYMVTGLMIAKGFSVLRERARQNGGGVELSGSAPTPVSDVGFGTRITKSTGTTEGDSWSVVEDIVFAYQLLKIDFKGWKGTKIKYDEFRHRAAYLSKDEESDEDEEEDDDGDDDNNAGGITGEVTASLASADNLPITSHGNKVTTLELGEGSNIVTCISTNGS